MIVPENIHDSLWEYMISIWRDIQTIITNASAHISNDISCDSEGDLVRKLYNIHF